MTPSSNDRTRTDNLLSLFYGVHRCFAIKLHWNIGAGTLSNPPGVLSPALLFSYCVMRTISGIGFTWDINTVSHERVTGTGLEPVLPP